FHRWHHTSPSEGGNANFAPLFSAWDVLFGTFYMPQGETPAHYGVDDPTFPQGFLGQLAYPFRHLESLPGFGEGGRAKRGRVGSAASVKGKKNPTLPSPKSGRENAT